MKKILKIFAIILLIPVILVGGLLLYFTFAPLKPIEETGKEIAKMPLEKQYFEKGPFEVLVDEAKFSGKHKMWVYYPANLMTENKKFPLIIAVNGTGTPAKKYENVLKHLASWGFVVIGNDELHSWFGAGTSESLHYALLFNNFYKESIFFGKIDEDKIGLFGHSQGGVGVFNAANNFKNSEKFKSLVTISPTQEPIANGLGWFYEPKNTKIPTFAIAGTGKIDAETITPLSTLEKIFTENSSENPVVIGRFVDSDHGNVQEKSTSYMVAWFLWTLQNDENAKKVFVGENAEISQNPNWMDVKIKNN